MSKLSNHWEAPLSPYFPYLQWSEIAGRQTDAWDISRHNHAAYELHIVLEGRCRLLVSNTEVPLVEGQGILLAPGAFHAPNRISAKFLRFSLMFFPDRAFIGQLPLEDGFLIFDTTEPIRFFCREILEEIGHRDSLLHKELLSSQFSQLMVHVLRVLGEAQSSAQEQQQAPRQLDEMAIIDRFFVATPPKLRTKENLAGLLNCSQRQVLRKIQMLYGVSFQKKQILSRLDTAQHLLRTTEKSIEEISHIVGYSDNAAFYRAFRLYKKMSPAKYRRCGGLSQDAQ